MTREQLIAALVLTGTDRVELADGYIDFSTRDDETTYFEVGTADEAVMVEMTDDDLRRLHAALTARLLGA